MTEFSYAESIVIDRTPQDVYDLVSDITRMGEWSPICVECWWDEGDSPRVGARFTGRNELPTRTWETRCEVVAAERGQEFAFVVGDGYVRWGYTFAVAGSGTQLTESWDFLPAGRAMFEARYGPAAPAEITARTQAAHDGIPATLAALKRAAELP
ncbi:MAG: SRPBCC family protein [Lapillicoccus sp.]